MATDPFASLRQKIRTVPKGAVSPSLSLKPRAPGPAGGGSSKGDPFATVRAKVKSSKPSSPADDLPKLSVPQRLARLEAAVEWIGQLGSQAQNETLQSALTKASIAGS
jgi:hypothetical protein